MPCPQALRLTASCQEDVLALRIACLLCTGLIWLATAPPVQAREAIPKGKALKEVVAAYVAATPGQRRAMRDAWDRTLAPLDPAKLPRLRKEILKLVAKQGRKLKKSGTNYWFENKRGKFIVSGKPGKTLFVGLHGGGKGSGDAGSAAGAMGGGGWWWIFPEVLEKTEHGWTDSGTEAWVMELIEAAKRSGRVCQGPLSASFIVETSGSPRFLGNPLCTCPALRPR